MRKAEDSYTTELAAIIDALEEESRRGTRRVMVVFDSTSPPEAIRSWRGTHARRQMAKYLAIELDTLNQLLDRFDLVVFQWSKSHYGIASNEWVDILAVKTLEDKEPLQMYRCEPTHRSAVFGWGSEGCLRGDRARVMGALRRELLRDMRVRSVHSVWPTAADWSLPEAEAGVVMAVRRLAGRRLCAGDVKSSLGWLGKALRAQPCPGCGQHVVVDYRHVCFECVGFTEQRAAVSRAADELEAAFDLGVPHRQCAAVAAALRAATQGVRPVYLQSMAEARAAVWPEFPAQEEADILRGLCGYWDAPGRVAAGTQAVALRLRKQLVALLAAYGDMWYLQVRAAREARRAEEALRAAVRAMGAAVARRGPGWVVAARQTRKGRRIAEAALAAAEVRLSAEGVAWMQGWWRRRRERLAAGWRGGGGEEGAETERRSVLDAWEAAKGLFAGRLGAAASGVWAQAAIREHGLALAGVHALGVAMVLETGEESGVGRWARVCLARAASQEADGDGMAVRWCKVEAAAGGCGGCAACRWRAAARACKVLADEGGVRPRKASRRQARAAKAVPTALERAEMRLAVLRRAWVARQRLGHLDGSLARPRAAAERRDVEEVGYSRRKLRAYERRMQQRVERRFPGQRARSQRMGEEAAVGRILERRAQERAARARQRPTSRSRAVPGGGTRREPGTDTHGRGSAGGGTGPGAARAASPGVRGRSGAEASPTAAETAARTLLAGVRKRRRAATSTRQPVFAGGAWRSGGAWHGERRAVQGGGGAWVDGRREAAVVSDPVDRWRRWGVCWRALAAMMGEMEGTHCSA